MSDFKFADSDSPPEPLQTSPQNPTPPSPQTNEAASKPAPSGSANQTSPAASPAVPKTVAPKPAAGRPLAPARPLTPSHPANSAAPKPAVAAVANSPAALRPAGAKPIILPIAQEQSPVPSPHQAVIQEIPPSGIYELGQSIKKVLDAMASPSAWALRIAFVFGLTALAYILAGTFLGNAGNLQLNPQSVVLTNNLDVATKILMIALLAASVSSLILGYEDNRLGFGIAVVGLALYFLVPLGLLRGVGASSATVIMARNIQNLSRFVVLLGLLRGLFDTVVWLWNLPNKAKNLQASVGVANRAEAKQRIIAREANMFSPCWKLPFCRETIRKQCPAFLAKKTCWKFGRGCYCDEEMISRIVRGESLDVIKAPTRLSQKGKPPCGRCYIYLEHQTFKFRMLSPLALPATILTSWLVWPAYQRIFDVSDKAFNGIWNTLTFNSSSLTPDAIKTSDESLKEISQMGTRPEDIAHFAQIIFGVLLGFMLLIYISKAIEWAIYKAKL